MFRAVLICTGDAQDCTISLPCPSQSFGPLHLQVRIQSSGVQAAVLNSSRDQVGPLYGQTLQELVTVTLHPKTTPRFLSLEAHASHTNVAWHGCRTLEDFA